VVRRGDSSELPCRTLHMREQLIEAAVWPFVSARGWYWMSRLGVGV
jgi:hypothetical protein